jgi:GT2 family glycosyltransferase
MTFDFLPIIPKVSIVVLNWNGLQDTLICLESLMTVDYKFFEIILVDNGSIDGSQEKLQNLARQNSKVHLVLNSRNLGFSGGANIGIRKALDQKADYVLLLNNDTRVSPSFLTHLVRVAVSGPNIGILGPKVYYEGRESVLYCAGSRVIKALGQPLMRGLRQKDYGQYNQQEAVGFISGCCLLIKKEVIEKIGLLDEDYFAFFEDLDWNIRAQKAGYQSVYVPLSVIWHKGSNTIGFRSPAYYFLHARNRIMFAKKHLGFLSFWLMFAPYFLIYRYLWANLSLALRGRWKQVRALHQGIFSAIAGNHNSLARYFG